MSDEREAAEARVGETLAGKWHLDKLLGVGGMAAVYAATHRNGMRGAVKLLHPELVRSADAKARFLREGYVANAVGHKGAVAVLDDDTTEQGQLYLVMELLEGATVEEVATTRPGNRLDPSMVLFVADELLDVLVAAHAKGIVHRDLKPENLFLGNDGRVRVLDFGIARLKQADSRSVTATKTGDSMGTPAFMPPEQALGNWDEVDGRTDLWAVGATMFTLLSGEFVHDGHNVQTVMLAAMTKRPRPLAVALPGVSSDIARIVDRALERERDARWADAAEMQRAVRAARDAFVDEPSARTSLAELVPAARAHATTAPAAGGATLAAEGPVVPARRAGPALLTAPPVSTDPAARSRSRSSLALAAALGVLVLAAAGFGIVKMVDGMPSATAPDAAGKSAAASAPSALDTSVAAPPASVAIAPAPTTTTATSPSVSASVEPSAAPSAVALVSPPRPSGAPPSASAPPAAASPSVALAPAAPPTEAPALATTPAPKPSTFTGGRH